MLRLHVFCTPISGYREIKIGDTRHNPWFVQDQKEWKILRNVSVRALRDDSNEGVRGLPGQRWDPGLEIGVPFEQRPVNEYSSLKDETLYSWAELSPGSFLIKLGGLWLTTFIVLGLPIAAASFNPSKEPLRLILAAGTGTLFLVSLIILRIYLGWSYVGDRLLSAVVPYEESGWYDGQMWVKPPEVKPVIKMLKQTLVGTGALLVSGVLLFIFATPVENFLHSTFTTEDISPAVRATNINTKFNIRKEELLRLPVDVKENDDLAAAAAEAADGRPVYCRNRLYRALAGGQYCKWEDLLR
ncbi:hypothetical protein KSS87_019399 [Heliosperma pusillum]|nr:hypothetical protein KSS87_019399 [Heliosperma pusillum]